MIVSDREIIRYKHGSADSVMDPVICEEWFNLYVNNKLVYQTPVLDQEIDALIAGLLYVKGHIRGKENYYVNQKGRSWYVSSDTAEVGYSFRQMVEEAFSQIDSDAPIPIDSSNKVYTADEILDLMREFQKLPSVYHTTGGVHMAAFATEKILFWADDVSRRNSVDKVIGKVLLGGKNPEDGIFVTSGRISSDIVIRLIKTGVKLIASVSAPMNRAITLAEHFGITLCGFVRGGRMNIYTHKNRVTTGEPGTL